MTNPRANIVRRNINVTIFVYEDDTCRVYIEDPLMGGGTAGSYNLSDAIYTTESVIDEWSLWLDILETAATVPTLREQLDAAVVTYHLTKDT